MSGSYRSAKSTQTFYPSEIPGVEFSGDEDCGHTLEVRFVIHCFTERHPYCDGFAEESLSEIIEDSYEYELDGVEVGRQELEERFGAQYVDELLNQMEDNATVN